MRSVPTMPVETSWILFTAWSIRSRMDLASFKKALPAGVSVIGRLSVEERDAKTVLQGMDLLGDRGLRNIKLIVLLS